MSQTNLVTVPKTSPITKTPEQRKAELSALMATVAHNRIDTPAIIMPAGAKAAIDSIVGVGLGELRQMAGIEGDTVPTAGEWRGFMMGKGKDVPGWGCGDGFTGKTVLAHPDGYNVSVKIAVTVYKRNSK